MLLYIRTFKLFLTLQLLIGSVSYAQLRIQSCTAVSAQTYATAHALGRGVNLDNMLEAPREGDWGVKADPALIDRAAATFKTVRVPIRWSNHAAPTADATLDPVFAARVDQVVDALLLKG